MKRGFRLASTILVILIAFNTVAFANQPKYTSANKVLNEIPTYKNNKVKGILVKVYLNKKGFIYGYEVSGHSGYAEAGEDIVCSGVSTLAQNTLTSIKLFTKDKVLETSIDAYLKCLVPSLKESKGSNEANVLLNSAILGFCSIETSYGDEYVKVFKVVK